MKLKSRKKKSLLWRTYDNSGAIKMAWGNIRRNIKISAKDSLSQCEVKEHYPRFETDCLKILEHKVIG
jgi:hypothetical protein